MAGYVGRLNPGDVLDAGSYFKGPWKSFERRALGAAETTRFSATDEEYSIFVTAGQGTFTVDNTERHADEGTAITVGLGSTVDITAGPEGLELFITTLQAS